MHRPVMAAETVRFAGDIVAAVLADSQYASMDAADLVAVDYDELPAVTDPREAATDETLLYPEVGTNVCGSRPAEDGPDVLDGCEVVVSGTVVSQRMAAVPLEPRSHRAEVGADGRLTAWLSTQTPHQDRDGLAMLLGLDPAQVRVVGPDVGGGFGAKGLAVEDLLVCWLARHTGRPVRWTETRSENMVAMNHGRAQVLRFSIGGTREGRVQAIPPERRRRRRRLPDARILPPQPDGHDGERGVRHPGHRLRLRHSGDEHDADRRVPRRRAPGGVPGDRAGDGHVRRRARHGPCRGAPA